MDSILSTVKKLIGGIAKDDDHFDVDIITHINSVFLELSQIGIGPEEGFSISDETSTWDEFIEPGAIQNAVRTYVYLKVKLIFDPPSSSFVIESINKTLDKLEWRLNSASETRKEADL